MHSYFDVSNPELVYEWDMQTQPLHTGKRHNIVTIHLIEDETGNAIINGHAVGGEWQPQPTLQLFCKPTQASPQTKGLQKSCKKR